jgi:hypothetical protein
MYVDDLLVGRKLEGFLFRLPHKTAVFTRTEADENCVLNLTDTGCADAWAGPCIWSA